MHVKTLNPNFTYHLKTGEGVTERVSKLIIDRCWNLTGLWWRAHHLIMAAHSSLYANDTVNKPRGFNSHSLLQ